MKNLQLKIMALLVGIGIWIYSLSLQDFQATFEVPLVFAKVPELLAVASEPPKNLSVTLEGPALELIRFRSQKKDAAIIINAENVEQGLEHFSISAANFYAPDFPEIRHVEGSETRSMDVEFDTKIRLKIPVVLTSEFAPANGYTFVEEPKVAPAEIELVGARTLISPIKSVKTKKELHTGLAKDAIFVLGIETDSLPSFVYAKDTTVRVRLAVQPIDNKKFENVPVNLIGIYDKSLYTLDPPVASVEITGGKSVLKQIKVEDLDIFIEYNRFAIENTNKLAPTVRLRDKNVNGMQLTPDKFELVNKAKVAAEAEADTAAVEDAQDSTVSEVDSSETEE